MAFGSVSFKFEFESKNRSFSFFKKLTVLPSTPSAMKTSSANTGHFERGQYATDDERSISGYRWRVNRKRALLRREGATE
jgi:hypothetical protein